jgi:hypothetical protein
MQVVRSAASLRFLFFLTEWTGEDKKRRPNPQKYLLYRPSFSQFQLFLSSAFKVC